MRRWIAILSVGALTACTGAAPALGASRFSAPITVAASGLPFLSSAPAVAVNASGNSVVAWNAQIRGRAYPRIDVRRSGPAGRLERVQQVGEGSAPQVAIAPDGTAAVVWEGVAPHGNGRRLLLASIAPPGRRFGRPQRLLLVKGSVSYFSVVATDERIVAAWGQEGPHRRPAVRYAVAPGDHLFGPDKTVAPSYEGFLYGAGADAAGNVIVTYDAPSPSSAGTSSHAAAVVLPAGASSFRAPETLAPSLLAQSPYEEPEKSFGDGPGGIAVGLSAGATKHTTLISTTFGAALSFSPPVLVGEIPNGDLTKYSGPVLALPSEGGEAAAWTVGRAASGDRIESPVTGSLMVSSEQGDGSFAVPVSLSRPATLSQYPVAAATDKTAIVAWGEGEFEREHLVYSVRAAGGSFTSPRGLARGVLRQPAIAGAGTHAVIAWIAGARLQMAVLSG